MPLHPLGLAASCVGSSDAGVEPCRQSAPRENFTMTSSELAATAGGPQKFPEALFSKSASPASGSTQPCAAGRSLSEDFWGVSHLIALQATKFLVPAAIRELRHAVGRAASPTVLPCKTSLWRSFATISSALCFFWGIQMSSLMANTLVMEDHFRGADQYYRSQSFPAAGL